MKIMWLWITDFCRICKSLILDIASRSHIQCRSRPPKKGVDLVTVLGPKPEIPNINYAMVPELLPQVTTP